MCNNVSLSLQGDPSTLPVNPTVLRLLEKAKAARVELDHLKKENSQHQQEDHHQQQKSSGSTGVVCSVCHVSLDKDQLSQFCLHCQKVSVYVSSQSALQVTNGDIARSL